MFVVLSPIELQDSGFSSLREKVLVLTSRSRGSKGLVGSSYDLKCSCFPFIILALNPMGPEKRVIEVRRYLSTFIHFSSPSNPKLCLI